ncbi:MAG: ATP-binding protein [Candidatus Zixiibacteriota bacterium]
MKTKRSERVQSNDQGPATGTMPEDSLVGLTRSVDAFGRTIDQLQAEYTALEQEHAALNARLSEINVQLESALAANRRLAAYLDRVLGEVPAGIIAVDKDGVIRLVNRTAAMLLNVTVDEVLNRRYEDVWPGRADGGATAAGCAAGHAPVTQWRREVPRPGQAPLVLSVSTVPLVDGDGMGETHGALEVFTDQSVFESMHAEVIRLRALASLGEMAATVAHEIRNPLGGMLGFAELLARHVPEDSEQQDMAQKIVTGARQLSQLVQRLLEFARDPKLALKTIEWPRFLESAVGQYEENARQRGRTIRFVRRWPERLPPGRADALSLRQAIWNVLENAEQAADGDSAIEVSASPREDGGVCVRVADRGCGIEPHILERAFMPFVTTREKGTGLGLAAARKLVEAHGGRISLQNREGGGAEVDIELPPVQGIAAVDRR